MNSRIMLIMTTALLAVSSVWATVVEQWTYDSSSPGTGINGTIVSTWTTNAPNSAPSAGVLRYADTTYSDWADAQLLPDIVTSTIASMTWRIQLDDFKVIAGSNFRFSTLTSAGGDIRPELEFTSFGTGPDVTFSLDMEYSGNTDALGRERYRPYWQPTGRSVNDCGHMGFCQEYHDAASGQQRSRIDYTDG